VGKGRISLNPSLVKKSFRKSYREYQNVFNVKDMVLKISRLRDKYKKHDKGYYDVVIRTWKSVTESCVF
jgi:hypothetical protein